MSSLCKSGMLIDEFPACFQCRDLFGESGGTFACFKQGEFLVVILQFFMGWGPVFLVFLALLILAYFSSLFDFDEFLNFSLNLIK